MALKIRKVQTWNKKKIGSLLVSHCKNQKKRSYKTDGTRNLPHSRQKNKRFSRISELELKNSE